MPDSAEDIASLLTCIYEPQTLYHSERGLQTDSPFVQGAMRLAIKYCVQHIQDAIRREIVRQWPSTLSDWEVWRKQQLDMMIDHELGANVLVDGQCFDDRCPEPASAIRFGRDFDTPDIMVSAFYELAHIWPTHDYDAFRLPREGYADPRPLIEVVPDPLLRTARWGLLRHDELLCLIQIREYIHRDAATLFMRAYDRVAESRCLMKKTCRGNRRLSESVYEAPDILMFMQYVAEGRSVAAQGLCHNCTEGLIREAKALKKEIWDTLSNILVGEGFKR